MNSGQIRRIRAVAVNISGATGPSGPSINGIYEPTDEICGAWPVYHKKDDSEKWYDCSILSLTIYNQSLSHSLSQYPHFSHLQVRIYCSNK